MNAGQGAISRDTTNDGNFAPGDAESGTGIFAGKVRLGINPFLVNTVEDQAGFTLQWITADHFFDNAGPAIPFKFRDTVAGVQWNLEQNIDFIGNLWLGFNGPSGAALRLDTEGNAGGAAAQFSILGSLIGNAGNIGMGVTYPNDHLHIFDNIDAARGILIENPNPGVNAIPQITFIDDVSFATIGFPSSTNATHPAAIVFDTPSVGGMFFTANNFQFLQFDPSVPQFVVADATQNIDYLYQNLSGDIFKITASSGRWDAGNTATTLTGQWNYSVTPVTQQDVIFNVDTFNGADNAVMIALGDTFNNTYSGQIVAAAAGYTGTLANPGQLSINSASGVISFFDSVNSAGATALLQLSTSNAIFFGGSGSGATVDMNGTISTSNPGGGVGVWQLGKFTLGALAQTGSVQVKVDGTIRRLLVG